MFLVRYFRFSPHFKHYSGTISSLCLLLLEHIYFRYIRQVITNTPSANTKPSYCAMDKSGLFFFMRKVRSVSSEILISSMVI